jgi:hypothetical protein
MKRWRECLTTLRKFRTIRETAQEDAMRRGLIQVLTGAVAVVALALGISAFLFPFEPTLVSHAQTPVAPIGLPATGFGVSSSEPLGLVPWIALAVAGAVMLAAAMFLAARRSKA